MARVLATSVDSAGHAALLLPLAAAARRTGHEVLVVLGPATAGRARGMGLAVHELPVPDDDVAAERAELFGRSMELIMGGERYRGDVLVVGEVFGRLNTVRDLGGLQDAVERFRPDVLLHDPLCGPALVAATAAGVPSVVSAWYPREGLAAFEAACAAGAAVASDREPEILADVLAGATRLSPLPHGADPSDVVRWRMRSRGRAAEASRPRPLVYATLGTVVGQIPPLAVRFLGLIHAAVAGLDVDVRITVGHDTDRRLLPAPPENVEILPFLDHAEVMPNAAVVVSHGGLNTVMDAAAWGRPQVVIPTHATDQIVTGGWLQDAGAGRCLLDEDQAPHVLTEALERALAGDHDRGAAGLAETLAALPSPDEAITTALARCV